MYSFLTQTYIYANDQVIMQHDGKYDSSKYFYLHDRLGSARLIMDTSAPIVKDNPTQPAHA